MSWAARADSCSFEKRVPGLEEASERRFAGLSRSGSPGVKALGVKLSTDTRIAARSRADARLRGEHSSRSGLRADAGGVRARCEAAERPLVSSSARSRHVSDADYDDYWTRVKTNLVARTAPPHLRGGYPASLANGRRVPERRKCTQRRYSRSRSSATRRRRHGSDESGWIRTDVDGPPRESVTENRMEQDLRTGRAACFGSHPRSAGVAARLLDWADSRNARSDVGARARRSGSGHSSWRPPTAWRPRRSASHGRKARPVLHCAIANWLPSCDELRIEFIQGASRGGRDSGRRRCCRPELQGVPAERFIADRAFDGCGKDAPIGSWTHRRHDRRSMTNGVQ